MELQLPFIRKILADNPHVDYHIWNLAREKSDYEWLKTIEGERITVTNNEYMKNPWTQFDQVYWHYAHPEYRDCRFIKIDDDVVFIESERFGVFERSIQPERIVSAKTINNGACTVTEHGLWEQFKALRQPLLDVHSSKSYVDMSHNYFFEHWEEMVNQDVVRIPTEDWLSINLIGYDWEMARYIAQTIKTPSPPVIAGRSFGRAATLGDEGLVNMLPRTIIQGFTACHLYFGPQYKRMPASRFDLYRQRYAEIGAKYLATS